MIAEGEGKEGRFMYDTLNVNGTTFVLQYLDTLAYAMTQTEASLGRSDRRPLPVTMSDSEFQN